MSELRIYSEDRPEQAEQVLANHADISAALATKGVRFERWQANTSLAPDTAQADILSAYATDIARVQADGGYQTIDVISMHPQHPDRAALRQKFLSEHRHGEDEVRFFVAGCGLFFLHLDTRVYQVLCEAGDLISVPANTRHWFDMGAEPSFTAIRFFNNPDGWVAHYTGDAIADRFPRL